MIKRGKNPSKLQEVVTILLQGKDLPEKYKDHKLRENILVAEIVIWSQTGS